MRIKRFSARDLPHVVAQIKEEFGLQAIILSQRALPDGLVEVTAGVRDEDLPPGAPPFELSGAENPPAPWGRAAYAREAERAPFAESPGEGGPEIPGAPQDGDFSEEPDGPFERALKSEAEKPALSAADLEAQASSSRLKAKPMGQAGRAPLEPGATGVRAGTLGPVGPAKAQQARGRAAPPQAPASQAEPSQAPPSHGGRMEGPRSPSPRGAQAPLAAPQASRPPQPPASGARPAAPPRPGPAIAPTVAAPGRLMPRARGAAPKPAPLTAPAMGAAAYRKVQAAPPGSDLGREIIVLKEQVGERFEELKTLLMDLAHRQSLSEKWRDRQDLVGLYRKLLETGLSAERAREFVEKAADSLQAWGGDLMEHLRLTARPVIRCLSPDSPLPRLMAMAGPSGSGKTTTLVRLAAFCQRRGLKVSAITLDTLRLGAAEQLGQYARIMGIGLKACQNKSQFDEALEIFEGSDVVLVDTNSRDLGQPTLTGETCRALMGAGARLLLAVPAGLKTSDLFALHARLAGPDLLGLVLTKLDESLALGNVVTFLAGSAAPLAFISSGPRIPEDFQAATADRVISFWLGEGA